MSTGGPAISQRYICIDGPIAVGKTTLTLKLAEYLDAKTVLEEFDDNPFLREFYLDPTKVAFQTQIYFLLARFKQQEKLRQQELFSRVMVSDYLFAKDRIFAYMNLAREEVALYERIYDLVRPQLLQPDLVIYLHAGPEALVERLQKRGRTYENTVEPSYLEELTQGYNHFFSHYDESPLLIVDTTHVNFETSEENFRALLECIANVKQGTHRYSPGSQT